MTKKAAPGCLEKALRDNLLRRKGRGRKILQKDHQSEASVEVFVPEGVSNPTSAEIPDDPLRNQHGPDKD